jgi:Tfp pilus assembly protein PilF
VEALDVGKDQDTAPPQPKGPRSTVTDFSQASLAAAQSLVDSGEYRRARLMLEDIVKNAPDAGALLLLAQLELDNPKRHPSALEHLRQAVVMAPENTEAWLTLANYWSMRGQSDKQRRCLEKILAYDPTNQDVRSALELILTKK